MPRSKPYRYQKKGVRIVHKKFNGRALIADEMGLGKTPQALWYADWYLDNPTVVIVCPANLKWNWQRECFKHCGVRASVIEGRTPQKKFRARQGHYYIINYDILGKPGKRNTWLNILRRLKPNLVVIDEVQYIKNPTAIRTRAVRRLCEKIKHILGLGGTGGLENCPAELFPIANILRPDVFDSFYSYAMEFCAPRRTYWGWEFKGATNLDKLHLLLKETCMIRRLKSQVLKDLPAKSRTVIPVDIQKKSEYKFAETQFIEWLMRKSKRKAIRAKNAERLVQLGYLKRLAAELKMKAVVEWIENWMKENPGRKLIVFGIHKKILDKLHEKYKDISVLVTGSVSSKERQVRCDRFNRSKKCRLFFGNIDAAGVGWSCTSASTVLFVELSWTPGKHVQAEDRIHGVGRGVKGVAAEIFYLVARGTIEEMLCEVLERKQKVIEQTLDGKKVTSRSTLDVLSQLEERLLALAS